MIITRHNSYNVPDPLTTMNVVINNQVLHYYRKRKAKKWGGWHSETNRVSFGGVVLSSNEKRMRQMGAGLYCQDPVSAFRKAVTSHARTWLNGPVFHIPRTLPPFPCHLLESLSPVLSSGFPSHPIIAFLKKSITFFHCCTFHPASSKVIGCRSAAPFSSPSERSIILNSPENTSPFSFTSFFISVAVKKLFFFSPITNFQWNSSMKPHKMICRFPSFFFSF